jgi:titin
MTFTSLTASVTNAVQIGEVIFLGRNVINPAYAPTFGVTTKSRNGFAVQISNYDTSFMWRAVAPAGMTATVSTTGLVKVSGVVPGANATVTIQTSRIGFTSGSSTFTGSALNSALVPIFDTPITSTTGFAVAITNYNPAFTWNVLSSAGTATLSGGVITVANVPAATSASITVTTERADFASGTAQISATSTQTGVTPTLTATVPTKNGFTTSISNFVGGYNYQVTSDAGTVTLGNIGAITVSGLNPGASATVTITASRSGYSTTSTTISGVAALGDAYIPVIGAVLSNATGFTASILNYNPAYSWSVSPESAGPTVSILNDEITVTGLALGVSSTVIVTATRIGYAPGTTQFSGVAIAPAVGTLGAQDLSFIVELSTATSTVAPQARIDIPALAASESTQFTVRANSSEVADAGFGSVQIQANGAGAAVTAMNVPIAILLPSVAANGIPSFSADGITWMRIPQLQSLELPAGQEMGYFTNDDGSITILTRRIG